MVEASVRSPVPAAAFLWKRSEGRLFTTVVCKLTFELRPGASILAEAHEPLVHGDQLHGDVEDGSVRIPNDFAPHKNGADVVVVGSVFSGDQAARSVLARVAVGGCDKTIEAFTERWFTQHGELIEGPPFLRVPLRWEVAAHAHDNPVGVRADATDLRGRSRVPQLQPPHLHIDAPGMHVSPTSFGPISEAWPARRGLVPNGIDPNLEAFRLSALVDRIDAEFFSAAPKDQRTETIRANERIVLEHLHPEHKRLVTSLPSAEPRALVAGVGDVPLVGDLLWIDADRGICTVTYRGSIDVSQAPLPLQVIIHLAGPESLDLSFTEETHDDPPIAGAMAPISAFGGKPPTMPFKAMLEGGEPEPDAEGKKPTRPRPVINASTQPEGMPVKRFGQTTIINDVTKLAHATMALPAVTSPFLQPSPPAPPPPSTAAPPSGVASTSMVGAAVPSFGPAPVAPMQPVSSSDAPPAGSWAIPPVSPVIPVPPQPAFVAAMIAPSALGAAQPPPVVALGHAPAASAFDASNLAAEHDVLGATPAAPMRPALSAVRSADSFDLLWFDPSVLRRLRVCFAELLESMPFGTRDPKHEMVTGNAEADQTRNEIFYCLVQTAPSDVGVIRQLAREGSDEFGRFVAPLVVVETDVRMSFAEADRLRTVCQIVNPFVGIDLKLKQVVDNASGFADASVPVAPNVASRLAQDIREQFQSSCAKVGGAQMLDAETERLLLETRAVERREVFGGPHARLLVGSQSDTVPLYLGEAGIAKLPLMDQFRGRVLAEIHPKQDRAEAHGFSLRALAVARSVMLSGR